MNAGSRAAKISWHSQGLRSAELGGLAGGWPIPTQMVSYEEIEQLVGVLTGSLCHEGDAMVGRSEPTAQRWLNSDVIEANWAEAWTLCADVAGGEAWRLATTEQKTSSQ